MTTPAEHDWLQVFPGDDGQVYWRRKAANGQIIATGAEGFTREEDAWRAAYRANHDLDPHRPRPFDEKP